MSPDFGRIPAQTQKLFADNAAAVRERVVAVLPPATPTKVRAIATELVLDVVLRDWHENSNTTGLIDSDVDDLRSFVALAASIAGDDLAGRGLPVFKSVLYALLQDWLANWNADGQPGPPTRQ